MVCVSIIILQRDDIQLARVLHGWSGHDVYHTLGGHRRESGQGLAGLGCWIQIPSGLGPYRSMSSPKDIESPGYSY
jgi:hypothetical protein